MNSAAEKRVQNGLSSQVKTLVVGLGKTGLSCARFLARRGVPVAITDSRNEPPALDMLKQEMPNLALFLGGFSAGVFEAAERMVVSPGVSVKEPLLRAAAARGVEIIGDIELFAREAAAPIIAITGSNGKSTVTTLVGAMAQQAGIKVAVGGNLGEPALDLLNDDVDLYVLELSSFQLETTQSLYTVAATVLNVSPDHLDRYDDLAEYAATKAKVYRGAEIGVINRDDPLVTEMAGQAAQEVGFTLGEPAQGDYGIRQEAGESWLCHGRQRLLKAAELKMVGRHNLANALAALALGEAIGLPQHSMLETLRSFPGLPHRSQYLGNRRGLDWYNDSKGTNPGATISALRGLHQPESESRTVLIAGGVAKGADFCELAEVVEQTARAIVLIGQDAPLIEEALSGTVPIVAAADMDEAVRLAADQAQPGDRVLLSPACASFDMFANFEARGDAFITALGRLEP